MNRRQIDGIAWLMAFIIVMVIGCLSMCSCKTAKTVTETFYVHDTVNVTRTDTVRDVKVLTRTDTVRQVEQHTYTLNNVGDTIREIHHYHDLERTIVIDSTERYRAKVDSLRKALIVLANKETVKAKPTIRPWEYVAAVLIVGVLAVWVLKSRIF